jgi:phosphate uptake regulator
LRFLTAAMKVNNDLERIADMAVNASQTGYYHLFKEPPVPQLAMITRMAEVAQKMLRKVWTPTPDGTWIWPNAF